MADICFLRKGSGKRGQLFCRLITGQEATCSAWNHDSVDIPAHLMVLIPLHVMLPSACFAHPKAMVGVMLASPVWLGGKGDLGVGWSEGVDAERPRGLLENGREQSAQHRKSSAESQLSCQADEHSQLVGGMQSCHSLSACTSPPGLLSSPRGHRRCVSKGCQSVPEQTGSCQMSNGEAGECRVQGKVLMRTLTPE